MTKRVAIYTRVSTDSQTTANQERELRQVADRASWRVVRVYADQAASGAKSRNSRPAFKAMCEDAARRRFDVIAAWSVDRLGRSLQDLVGFLTEIHALRVDLYLHQQAVDTSSPAGRALFQMLGVFAEFERALIVDRVKAGLERARAEGTQLGRPRLDPDKEGLIRAALAVGDKGLRKIAVEFGVGTGTVQRIKTALTSPGSSEASVRPFLERPRRVA